MRYLPLTADERKKILDLCGVKNFEELTSSIPENLRLKGKLDVERALSELELDREFSRLAAKNDAAQMTSFLGQGVYDHFWPTVIDQITNRGEFLTAYTPYQPEISQGTLQCIFEFQSLVSELMGMEIANASLYDGGTALVEAILMAARLKNVKSGTVLVSEGTYPRIVKVLESYLLPLGFKIKKWKSDPKTFQSQTSQMPPDADVFSVVLQSPNQWGLLEDWGELKQAADKFGAKSIAYVAHPHALSLYAPPGEADIDLACAEGQTLGIPVGFGGPYLGLFCCRRADIRQMPGRLVGETVDARGERAFCVTLSTREQHIRREKATSNICSNQNLMALRATMYITLMGPVGMQKVATLSHSKAEYARRQFKTFLKKQNSPIQVLDGEIFNEVTLLIPSSESLWVDQIKAKAESFHLIAGVAGPVPTGAPFVSVLNLAFTEKHPKSVIDQLVHVLTEA